MRDKKVDLPVVIENGPMDWQVLQQDAGGSATVKLSGRWRTVKRRKTPEVVIRVTREGSFTPASSKLEWRRAKTTVDASVKGARAGKSGKWSITLKNIPRGGPYRIATTIGSSEDTVEWRTEGQSIEFLCVGDVWLIAGQSNAEGYGRDPTDDPAEIGVHHLSAEGWEIASHGLRHHPWLLFAKRLRRELGYPIGLIPTAVGGSAVSHWDPGQNGVLFANMKRRLRFSENRIRGCVWYQGESDVGEEDHPKYKKRFSRFVKGVRQIVKDSALPIITVQLNRVIWEGSAVAGCGWEAMREIQRSLAHEMKNVFVFSIFEAGLCDGIHISSGGNMLIADRAAAVALGGVYARDVPYLHPECTSVKKKSSKRIELYFKNVVTRLDYEGALEYGFPFVIRDKQGEVPVKDYKVKKDVISIKLERFIEGTATVTGAPGSSPPSVVPKDISGYRGMLAFTRKVEEG